MRGTGFVRDHSVTEVCSSDQKWRGRKRKRERREKEKSCAGEKGAFVSVTGVMSSQVEIDEILSEDEVSLIHYISGISNEVVNNQSDTASFSDETIFGEDFEISQSSSQEDVTDQSSSQEDITKQGSSQEDVIESVDIELIDIKSSDGSEEDDDQQDIETGREERREEEISRLMTYMSEHERVEYMVRTVIEEAMSSLLIIEESKIESEQMVDMWLTISRSYDMSLVIPRIVKACDQLSYRSLIMMSNFKIKERERKDMITLLLLVGVASFIPRSTIVSRRLRCRLGRYRAKLSDKICHEVECLSVSTILEVDETIDSWRFEMRNCFY